MGRSSHRTSYVSRIRHGRGHHIRAEQLLILLFILSCYAGDYIPYLRLYTTLPFLRIAGANAIATPLSRFSLISSTLTLRNSLLRAISRLTQLRIFMIDSTFRYANFSLLDLILNINEWNAIFKSTLMKKIFNIYHHKYTLYDYS